MSPCTPDDGFASLFARVREQLDGRKEQYAGEIKSMQQLIRKVTELSVKVESRQHVIRSSRISSSRRLRGSKGSQEKYTDGIPLL